MVACPETFGQFSAHPAAQLPQQNIDDAPENRKDHGGLG
jgi:hypothetical protein